MKTNYDLINENIGTLVELSNNKIIPFDVINYLQIYDAYRASNGTKTERYEKVGKKFNRTAKTVQRIVLLLNKPTKK